MTTTIRDRNGQLKDDPWSIIHRHPRNRVWAFYFLAPQLDDVVYWKLLEDVWHSTNFQYRNLNLWTELFTSKRRERQCLMQDNEQARYSALPDRVEAWRGGRLRGLSWTLDREMAVWFGNRWGVERARQKGHFLYRCTIPKKRLVACFDYEQELIVVPPIRAREGVERFNLSEKENDNHENSQDPKRRGRGSL